MRRSGGGDGAKVGLKRMASSLVARLLVVFFFLILQCVVEGKVSGVLQPNKYARFTAGFRPPSVPLVVVDPFSSVWSMAENLYDDVTRFWTGSPVNMSGMMSIDDAVYRFMSNEPSLPEESMKQVNVSVFPTQTVYTFQQDGVQLVLTFSTPAVWNYLCRFPVTFLSYYVRSVDGRNHTVRLYYDNSAEGTVSDNSHIVMWERVNVSKNYDTMRIGNFHQNYCYQSNDRIDWGYWFVQVAADPSVSTSMAYTELSRMSFITNSPLPPDDKNQPRPCDDMTPALAVAWDLGVVSPGVTLSRSLTLAYDQVYSINYFGTLMAPQWRQEFGSAEKMLAEVNRDELMMTMDSEDDRITSQLYAEGGSNYTTISSLAWRQATGATVAVYNQVTDETWMFMKEISSDGDVSTVDVVYPASPLFLWNYNGSFSPIKLILLPILNYANNQTAKYGLNVTYNLSWAPHHLGRWPVCDLPPYLQEQMPMEESGNMLIMLAYLVKRDGDLSFLEPYWNLLSIWGEYLAASLPDPQDQLCTDDFEGPSPHNSNLAVKGMVGLRAYAYLLEKNKEAKEAEELEKMDLNFTKIWWLDSMDGVIELHSRLQYNLHDTWSLKYNFLFRGRKLLDLIANLVEKTSADYRENFAVVERLVTLFSRCMVSHLQQVMNFTDIFTDEDITRELKFYMTRINEFGIPLDDRQAYTKADWQMWVAAMGTQDQFETITDLVYAFADNTPNMVPMTDWYYTFTAELKGFRARPVVGGFFSRMLLNYAVKA